MEKIPHYTDESILTWGRYRGFRLIDIPDDYLLWIWEQEWLQNPQSSDKVALKIYLRDNLDAIKENAKKATN